MKMRHLKLFKKFKILNKIYKYNIGKKILFIFLGKKKDNQSGWPVNRFPGVSKTDQERVENMTWILSDKTPFDYSQFKGEAVLKISTYKRLVDRITNEIKKYSNIKEYQFVFVNETEKSNSKDSTKEITKLDYDEQFKNYMIKNSPDGLVEVMKKELYEVLK